MCRLNDGLAKNTPFPSRPPESLNLDQAVADLNTYRAAHDLAPIKLDTRLIQASKRHSDDLAQNGGASHTGSDGSTPAERVLATGYDYRVTGENVATGQKSWSEAFKAWQDSPNHNSTLLMKDATDFGIAITYMPQTTYQTYWTMIMARPLKQQKK